MKKTLLSLIVLALLVIQACTSESLGPQNPEMAFSENANYSSFRVSPEDALQIALKAIGDAEGTSTRAMRNSFSLEIIGGKATRSNGIPTLPDSALYLFNFEEGNGFALVSGDKRTKPIYAFSDTGSLNLSDTTQNKGLAMVLNMIYEDIDYIAGLPIVDSIHPFIPNPGITPPKPNPDNPITPGYTLVKKISPMLHENVRTYWDQTHPFNLQCPIINGEQCVVGCSALAAAMIMSHFEWPEEYEGHIYNWSQMKIYDDNNDLHLFLRRLGDSKNLDINYGIDNSGASPSNFRRTFKNFGYQLPSDLIDFSSSFAETSLSNNSPLIITGKNNLNNKGHGWVIDGVMTYKTDNYSPSPTPYYFSYWHCVWGSVNIGNGYFSIGTTVGPYAYTGDPTDRKDENGEIILKDKLGNKTHYYDLKIMGNFKPNK